MNDKEILGHVESLIETHAQQETVRYNTLESEISNLRQDIRDLLEMWNQTKGVLFFLKWLVGIAGSIIAVLAYFKGVK